MMKINAEISVRSARQKVSQRGNQQAAIHSPGHVDEEQTIRVIFESDT